MFLNSNDKFKFEIFKVFLKIYRFFLIYEYLDKESCIKYVFEWNNIKIC